MKECMAMNICYAITGGLAIGIACYVTKSAWPLLGFTLLPKFNYHGDNKEDNKDGEND